MALSVDYLYNFCLKLIRKNQAGGLASKDFEFQWNDAQSTYLDDLLGRFQARNNGKEGVNTGLILDETILQKLSPFTTTESISIVGGNVTKPTDFIYRLGFRINGEDGYKINHGQIATVNNNVIDPPSITSNKYFFVEYEDYYYVLPHTDLDYITVPKNIVWGYYFNSSDRQVYNPGTSVQPQWDSSSCREITKRMLKNLGVSYKDADFAQFGQSVQLTGE